MGTLRLVPCGSGLAVCETLSCMPRDPAQREHAWEVGRLVLAPDCGVTLAAFKRCMFRELSQLLRARPVAHLYGTCHPNLARLYRRFGFAVIASGDDVAADGAYCLVHASVAAVLAQLAHDSAPSVH